MAKHKQTQKPGAAKVAQERQWWITTNADHWTDWANGNQRGSAVGPIFCPYPVSALRGREQAGYGLINLCCSFRYPDGTEGWTDWITMNFEGSEVRPVRCPTGQASTGIEVWEQAGCGLVDARLTFSGGTTDWLTNNNQGWLESLFIPNAKKLTGMEAREEGGYGLINLRLHYVD